VTATDILRELVVRPKVVAEVRDEVKKVLEENNDVLDNHALFKMKLLDSVMRESQRLNPFSESR
jgi:hypothetical protein